MAEGYMRNRPDADWWLEQLQQGERFRKREAFQDKWPIWREYYRGQWASDTMPVNLFFTMMRVMVPRVYFRNPSVSIMPAKPGFLHLAFARMLERVDNSLMRQMKVKRQMKRVVRDAIMKGTGVGKMGFGGKYTPTPLAAEPGLPVSDKGHRLEYMPTTRPSMPWFQRVAPENFIVPNALDDFENTRWTAERVDRPLEDVLNDPRFENTRELKAVQSVEVGGHNAIIQRPVKMVKLFEIRDWKTGKVFVVAPDHGGKSKVIFYDDDAFQNYGGFNYFPLIFNEDDTVFWGVPDSQIMEPYQLELNEIRTQTMKHRRVTLIKVLVKEGGMDPSEAEKLVSEDVQAVAFVRGQGSVDANVKVMQQSTIPRELFLAADTVMQDTRETLGMSRNQAGEFNSRSGDTTATEASIVNQAMEIRIDEKRDAVADMLLDMINMQHMILFDNWGEDQIIDVLGPGGVPVWVRMRPELLRTGMYSVKIDPDSALPQTKQLREQRALLLYERLRTNPLIDPVKLTQYLLNEMQGTQFDDMLRMMPPQPGADQGVLEPEQYGNMLQQAFQQLPATG